MRETKTKKSLFGLLIISIILAPIIALSGVGSGNAHAADAPIDNDGGGTCTTANTVFYFTDNSHETITSESLGTDDGTQCTATSLNFTLRNGVQPWIADTTCHDTVSLSKAPTADDKTGPFPGTTKLYNVDAGGNCAVLGGNNNVTVYTDRAAAIASIPAADPAPADGTTTCGIQGGLGWIICPVARFAGQIADNLYTFVSTTFLATNIQIVSTGTGTYTAWQTFLAIANVSFVIIFLLIIFSQATGYGISNYGVKKMLPKLIIGVILINLSFFICQAAVDVSNILGYGIKSFFDKIGGADVVTWDTILSNLLSGAAVAVGAAATIALLNIGIGLPTVLIAALTLVFIALFLIVRQVLIIMCVVLAPVAFAAWLLPNTEKLFKRWWKIFYAMLIVFPLVSLVLGASGLASNVITKSLTKQDTAAATAGKN